MKRMTITLFAAAALAACSSTTTTDGGTGTGGSTTSGGTSGGGTSGGFVDAGGEFVMCGDGGIDVTIQNIGVAPEAAAALAALPSPITPPSLAPTADGGYTLVLQGVSIGAGASIKTTTLCDAPLTAANDTGPITFTNLNLSGGVTSVGIISAIVSDLVVAGGSAPTPNWPSCSQLAASSGNGSYVDSFISAGNQVHVGTPTTSISGAVAFAVPASYVALLDCAAGFTPGTADLWAKGFALMYASADASGQGSPESGVTFGGVSGSESLLYYPAGYAANSASATAPTSANGVATLQGVALTASVSATGPGGTYPTRTVGMSANSAYLVLYSPN